MDQQQERARWSLSSKAAPARGVGRNDLFDRGHGRPASTAAARLVCLAMGRAVRKQAERKKVKGGLDLLCRCGQWLWDAGSRKEAIEAFEEVVRISPSSVRAHNNLGVAYWNLGDRASAVRHFRVARDLDPSDRDAVWNCGQIMVEVGELLSARFLFEDYLRQFGPDQDIATALVDLSLYATRRTVGSKALVSPSVAW